MMKHILPLGCGQVQEASMSRHMQSTGVQSFSLFFRHKIPSDAVQVVQRPLAAPHPPHRACRPPHHGHVRRHPLRQLSGKKFTIAIGKFITNDNVKQGIQF